MLFNWSIFFKILAFDWLSSCLAICFLSLLVKWLNAWLSNSVNKAHKDRWFNLVHDWIYHLKCYYFEALSERLSDWMTDWQIKLLTHWLPGGLANFRQGDSLTLWYDYLLVNGLTSWILQCLTTCLINLLNYRLQITIKSETTNRPI